MIEALRTWITVLFLYVLYPVCILGMFAMLFAMLFKTIDSGKSKFAKVRRSVGALLPFISLILVVATGDKYAALVDSHFSAFSWYMRFLMGLFLGTALMEAMVRFEVESDVINALFAFWISGTASFVVWLFLSGIFTSFNLLFLGIIFGAGFHFIFRGKEEMWGT